MLDTLHTYILTLIPTLCDNCQSHFTNKEIKAPKEQEELGAAGSSEESLHDFLDFSHVVKHHFSL